jgi:DNA-binding beta-propeller fold protein YncE
VDDTTLAVGNRDGSVAIIKAPREMGGRHLRLEPLSIVRGKGFSKLAWPGSVAVTRSVEGAPASVLACNNYIDRVSEHFIDPAQNFRETGSRVVYARGVYIPDGVALSPDGDSVAISSHGSHTVPIYSQRRTGRLAAPLARLSGAIYPHGLRFTADGEHLLVADAGSPYLHVFERGAGWTGERRPARSVQVLDDETYLRGRTQPDEGGPKGIDIDPRGRFVAICCEEVRLKIVSLDALLGFEADSEQAAGATAVV